MSIEKKLKILLQLFSPKYRNFFMISIISKKISKPKNEFSYKNLAQISLAFFLFSSSITSYACAPYQLIGSICITAANFCPRGFLEANAQLIQINTNSALFSLLGTTHGGDGERDFALPDLRGRSIIGTGQGPDLSPITQGQVLGRESVTLTQNNLPAHTHPVTLTGTANTSVTIPISANSGSNVTAPSGQAYLSASPPNGLQAAQIWSSNATPVATVAGVTAITTINGDVVAGPAGNSQPFNIRPPQLALRYCIATTGVYPASP